jgi:hypothetical protein
MEKSTIFQLGKSTISIWAMEKIDFSGLVGFHQPPEPPEFVGEKPKVNPVKMFPSIQGGHPFQQQWIFQGHC